MTFHVNSSTDGMQTGRSARRLRILHVVFSLEPGGMENGIANVSAALPATDFEIHACCLARAGEFAARFPNPDHIHVIGKREGFSLSAVSALSRHIRRLSPDVIHTHNLGPLIYTVLARPSAPILHGEHAEFTPGELAPHRLLLRRLLYRRVRRVHTVSQSLKESLVSHGFPAGKIDVIVNGVDAGRFSPGSKADARRELGLPLDGTILGLVGRFGAFKRHIQLIEAFDQLALSHFSLRLLLAGGGGPMEERVRARAAGSPYSSRIHFTGFLSDPRSAYRALDLLVIPSTNEGLSNALLEAMASGIPALAHTACGHGEVIQDPANGYLRDLSTTGLLRDALAGILSTPERLAPLGSAARQTIEERFTIPGMVAGYERLYRQMAGTAPRPAELT
jgi:glycosyltransferase involved in cell wall biosynthesis